MAAKTYSIIVVPDDHSGTRQYRISRALLISSTVLGAIFLVTVALFVATYARVLERSRDADALEIENQELRAQIEAVDALARELEGLTSLRAQVVEMLGSERASLADIGLVEGNELHRGDDALADVERLQQLFADEARKGFAPREWPVDGRVRREFRPAAADGEEAHPGLAIESEPGAVVRAAGRGRVVESDVDEQGRHVLVIDHGYGFRSLYRGITIPAVDPGQRVERKQVLGRLAQGDSDRGSRGGPPVLYFEVRIDGSTVDPRLYLEPR